MITSCFPPVGAAFLQQLLCTAALESHVSCTLFKPQVSQYRPSLGSSFSNPGVLQEEQRCYTEKWKYKTSNLEFQRSEVGYTKPASFVVFLKKISHISACNFISNHFCSCTYFQEFVNVSLNSGKKIGSCNLTGLWDSTDYSVAIRCINDGSAFWSGWSGEKNGSTEEKGKLPTCNSFPLLHFEALGFCREKPCFSILSIYWI